MQRYRAIRTAARFLLFLAALLLPSCVRSSNPLSDPDGAKLDARLSGAWKCSNKSLNAPHYWFIFVGNARHRHGPPGLMKVIEVANDKENNVTVKGPLCFFPTSLGGRTYANLFDGRVLDPDGFSEWDKKNVKEYLLVKYGVEEDTLTIWLMDPNAAEAAIAKGQVKGTIEEKGLLKLKTVCLTSGEDLARFLSNGGDKLLFPESNKIVFRRTK